MTTATRGKPAILTAPSIVRTQGNADECGLVAKAADDSSDVLTFAISSESVDLVGDVVVQSGITPVATRIPAQVDHSGQMRDVIGEWRNLRLSGKKTLADLHLLPKGVSRIADLVRGIADAGVRLASSIGFRPVRDKVVEIVDRENRFTGYRFLEVTLLEVSVVVVPAQSDALQVRSLLNPQDRSTLDQMVATRAARTSSPRTSTQSSRSTPALLRKGASMEGQPVMKTIAEQIAAAEAQLTEQRDEQTEVVRLLDAADEADRAVLEERGVGLAEAIEKTQETIERLRRMETSLKSRATPAGTGGSAAGNGGASVGGRAAEVIERRGDGGSIDAQNIIRAALLVGVSHCTMRSLDEVAAARYPGNEAALVIAKAAQNPAMTTVVGWAAELVRETFGAYLDTIKNESVIPKIPMLRMNFDSFGKIVIPRRDQVQNPNLAGGFRAEGGPIRVGALALGSAVMTPKSLGVIGTFTREMARRSTPSIEAIIRDAMSEDTAMKLDTVFLGSTPGSAIQPPGIQVGAGSAASTGTAPDQIMADTRAMVQRMIAAGGGRRPVWIMNDQRLTGLQSSVNGAGALMFPSTIGPNPTLHNYPIVTSLTVPGDIVYLMDAAAFAFATGAAEFDYSEQATLHEEDTAPLPIVAGGTAATPVRSLWQTNSAGIRMLGEVDWTNMRAAGVVQILTAVAW